MKVPSKPSDFDFAKSFNDSLVENQMILEFSVFAIHGYIALSDIKSHLEFGYMQTSIFIQIRCNYLILDKKCTFSIFDIVSVNSALKTAIM